jgi:2-oxoglutarate ferredoxin oxidoreductase subunit beta
MVTVADYRSHAPTWCPGCGDFAVLRAMQQAVVNLGLQPHEVVLVGGIGCSGKITDYFRSYGLHGIHGRALPVATGIKLANRDLTVLAAGGDGDGYSIGGNHLIHAIRRNVDLTYIVMDNGVYGLTKGQSSPTARLGYVSKSTPEGVKDEPVHPAGMAMSCGIAYLAQAFAGDVKHMTTLIEGGITHEGFALVNIFSPCVTYNRVNTYDWYRDVSVNLDEVEDYDPTNREMAVEKVMDFDNIYIGLLYRSDRPAYEAVLPGYPETPIASQDLEEGRGYRALMEQALG